MVALYSIVFWWLRISPLLKFGGALGGGGGGVHWKNFSVQFINELVGLGMYARRFQIGPVLMSSVTGVPVALGYELLGSTSPGNHVPPQADDIG